MHQRICCAQRSTSCTSHFALFCHDPSFFFVSGARTTHHIATQRRRSAGVRKDELRNKQIRRAILIYLYPRPPNGVRYVFLTFPFFFFNFITPLFISLPTDSLSHIQQYPWGSTGSHLLKQLLRCVASPPASLQPQTASNQI